jgi:large subunit ribosomal protein L35
MPKIKSHKASKKRFKQTASGKLKHWKQFDNAHLRTKKSNRRKRRLAGSTHLTNNKQVVKIKTVSSI